MSVEFRQFGFEEEHVNASYTVRVGFVVTPSASCWLLVSSYLFFQLPITNYQMASSK
jgi:hypothetical protein